MRLLAAVPLVMCFASGGWTLAGCSDAEHSTIHDNSAGGSDLTDGELTEDAAAGDTGLPAPVRADETYEMEVTLNVTYAQGIVRDSWETPLAEGTIVDLLLDIAEPIDAPKPRPALMLIHGGGFSTGHSLAPPMVMFADYLVVRGWVVFSINYRLEDDHGNTPEDWPASAVPDDELSMALAVYAAGRDAKAAMRWAHANAENYGIHPDHIAVLGGSAGAALAIMLGTTNPGDYRDEISTADDPTLSSTHLNHRADVAAIIDHWGSGGLVEALQARDGIDRFDPSDAPISIIHGIQDATVPFSEAETLRDTYQQTGVPYKFSSFQGGHGAWTTVLSGRTLPELAFEFLVSQQGLHVEP